MKSNPWIRRSSLLACTIDSITFCNGADFFYVGPRSWVAAGHWIPARLFGLAVATSKPLGGMSAMGPPALGVAASAFRLEGEEVDVEV